MAVNAHTIDNATLMRACTVTQARVVELPWAKLRFQDDPTDYIVPLNAGRQTGAAGNEVRFSGQEFVPDGPFPPDSSRPNRGRDQWALHQFGWV